MRWLNLLPRVHAFIGSCRLASLVQVTGGWGSGIESGQPCPNRVLKSGGLLDGFIDILSQIYADGPSKSGNGERRFVPHFSMRPAAMGQELCESAARDVTRAKHPARTTLRASGIVSSLEFLSTKGSIGNCKSISRCRPEARCFLPFWVWVIPTPFLTSASNQQAPSWARALVSHTRPPFGVPTPGIKLRWRRQVHRAP